MRLANRTRNRVNERLKKRRYGRLFFLRWGRAVSERHDMHRRPEDGSPYGGAHPHRWKGIQGFWHTLYFKPYLFSSFVRE